MGDILEYNGHRAKIQFSAEDGCLIGRVLYIPDSISFHGESVEEVTKAFHESIDSYLAFQQQCRKSGDYVTIMGNVSREDAECDKPGSGVVMSATDWGKLESLPFGTRLYFAPKQSSLAYFDNGPWRICSYDPRRIESGDFMHDVQIEVYGDFISADQRKAYMQALCNKLNTICDTK